MFRNVAPLLYRRLPPSPFKSLYCLYSSNPNSRISFSSNKETTAERGLGNNSSRTIP